jgi:DNA-binding transcriptional regulator PaaX
MELMKVVKGLGLGGKILFYAFDDLFNTVAGEDFFMTPAGMRKMSRRLAVSNLDLFSAIHRLKRKGYLEKKKQGFFITSKGARVASMLKIEQDNWWKGKWDGFWRTVIFDVPESKRGARNTFRGFLKRKGFVQLQKSVFVSPFADIESLNFVRHEYGVTNYVHILLSKTASSDDDVKLRHHFGL